MTHNAPSAIDPRPAAHRRPGLDLLRAIAIILVVPYHAGLFGFELPFGVQKYGWVGVDLFFVLSGYLIGGQLLSLVARHKPIDIRRFYTRRALRILPAYFVVVGLYVLLPVSWREYQNMAPLWKFLTFTQNLGLRGGTNFSHAWSLCIEFQFYLILPLILTALSRLGAANFLMLPAILVVELSVRGLLAYRNLHGPHPSFGQWQQWIYYATYARLDGLSLGVSLAALEIFRPKYWLLLTATRWWLWLGGIVALIVALCLAEDGLSVVSSAFGFLLVALACATFLVSAADLRRPIPGAAFIATISYSVYLTHKLAIHWMASWREATSIRPAAAYPVMLLCVLAAGCACFFGVERPFLRIREKTSLSKRIGDR